MRAYGVLIMKEQIGQVFTPLKWAEWLINKWGIFEAWLDGAHICDPTAGQGAFPLAILHIARRKGVTITAERLSRLTLIEVVPSHLERFKENVKCESASMFRLLKSFAKMLSRKHTRGHTTFSLETRHGRTSEIYRPPYKAHLKPFFVEEGLVPDRQKTLLGASRVDIAALVLKVVLGRLLTKNGMGCFYIPTSLFFGEGAHTGFRNYSARGCRNGVDSDRDFAVDTVYEFTSTKVFEGVDTSYGCAKFQIDTQQNFPIRYVKELDSKWIAHKALPLKNPTDPWRVVRHLDELNTEIKLEIRLAPDQKPRQGVNTCGANSVFIFDGKPSHLPEEFLYPLATKEIWRENISLPQKWILLPYHQQTGKPLTWHEIEQWDTLKAYLQEAQNTLQARQGTLLRSAMNRGIWWALLGVGAYAFAPFKVIWEAYGKSDFTPVVLSSVDEQMWQGNQAMHAFIPCWTECEAQRIKTALENPAIPTLLRQLNGAGKCNWAQPGKIKKILEFDRET